jgi:hypothetical protein
MSPLAARGIAWAGVFGGGAEVPFLYNTNSCNFGKLDLLRISFIC